MEFTDDSWERAHPNEPYRPLMHRIAAVAFARANAMLLPGTRQAVLMVYARSVDTYHELVRQLGVQFLHDFVGDAAEREWFDAQFQAEATVQSGQYWIDQVVGLHVATGANDINMDDYTEGVALIAAAEGGGAVVPVPASTHGGSSTATVASPVAAGPVAPQGTVLSAVGGG